jgi:hypothetical protein
MLMVNVTKRLKYLKSIYAILELVRKLKRLGPSSTTQDYLANEAILHPARLKAAA